jgi:hypothetical protein
MGDDKPQADAEAAPLQEAEIKVEVKAEDEIQADKTGDAKGTKFQIPFLKTNRRRSRKPRRQKTSHQSLGGRHCHPFYHGQI